jgi:hypothetical protein
MQPLGEKWVKRWQRAIGAAEKRGARNVRLEIDPPATVDEVTKVESSIGKSFPEAFRKTLIEFSRRVEFFWFLRAGDSPPGDLDGIFCGGCNWDLDRLPEMYGRARWLSENAFVEETPEAIIWREKLPFHQIATGDFIAIDVSSDVAQSVVYLSHELCYSHGYVLSADFLDFMNRWTAIGCPDDDIWPRFMPEKDKFIDLRCPNTVAWCEWFGLPQPTGDLFDSTAT